MINPFTVKCGQRQISSKVSKFHFLKTNSRIAECESTGRELSFEWSHHRISSTDSKVRVTLQNSIKHSGSERVKGGHECIAVLGQFRSGQVNFYLSSHRVLIQLSVLNITKKIVKKEKKFFNFRFIVQSLGYLNSAYN